MADNVGQLNLLIGADASGFLKGTRDAAAGAAKLDKDTSGAFASIVSASKVMAAGVLAATGVMASLGAAAFALGSEFDSAYDSIAVGTGATGEKLDGLQDVFRNVVSSVPTDFALASQAIAELSQRTGLTGTALETLTGTTLEMTRLFGGDLSGNIRLATRVFGDWGITAENQSLTMDKVAKASQLTGVGVQDLMGKVVQFGAPLRAMNFSFDESVAMLGKWEKEGVNTELVLGSMRIAMGHFAEANIPMREGLEATFNKIMELGPGAAATSLAMETFGARAGPDMAAAILEGRFALGDLVTQLGEAGGTIADTSASTADGAEAMQLAFNKIKLAFEPFASAVFSFVGGAALDLLERFESVTTVGEAVKAVLSSIEEAVSEVTGVALPLNDAWDAMVTAVQSVIDTGASIIRFFQDNTLAVDALLAALAGLTAVGIAQLVLALPGLIAQTAASIVAFYAQAAAAAAAAAATLLAAAPFIALGLVFGVLVLAGIELYRNWDEVAAAAGKLWEATTAAFTEIGTAIGAAWNSVTAATSAAWDGVVATVRGAVNGVIGMINRMISAINSIQIHVPAVDIPLVGIVGGFTVGMPQIPLIPMLATGGHIQSDGLAFLHAGETVVPAGVARGGSGGITVIINGPVYSEIDFERKVAAAVTQARRRGGLDFVRGSK